MLHIIKQIKGGFMGFIANNFAEINKADLQAIASIDGKNDKISKKDIEGSNSPVAKLILRALEDQESIDLTSFGEYRMNEIKELLENQGHEIVDTIKRYHTSINKVKSNLRNEKNEYKEKISVFNMDRVDDEGNVRPKSQKKVSKVAKKATKKEASGSKKVNVRNESKENTYSIKEAEELIASIDWNTLAKNQDNTEYVEKLQRALKVLGYNLGKYGPDNDGIDGSLGDEKSSTMKAYIEQRKKNRRNESVKDKSSSETSNTKIESVNHKFSGPVAEKYSENLNTVTNLINLYQEGNGENDFISRNIGVIGLMLPKYKTSINVKGIKTDLRSILHKDESKKLISTIESKYSFDPEKMAGMLSLAVTAIFSYALSGGTSVSIQLFGVKIGEHPVELDSVNNILVNAGFSPVKLRNVIRDKDTSREDMEALSDQIMGKNFDGGGIAYAIDNSKFKDIPTPILKSLFKLLGYGSELISLNEKLQDPKTNIKERKIITGKIQDELDKDITKINNNINKLKKGDYRALPFDLQEEYNNTNIAGISNNLTGDIFNKGIKELENSKQELIKLFQGTTYKINDRVKDFRNKAYPEEMNREVAELSKKFDKDNNLKPLEPLGKLDGGKFGPDLGIGWTKWFEEMKTKYNPEDKGVTALAYLVATYEATSALNKTNLEQFETGLRNGRYLNNGEVEKFKDILNKNMSTTLGGNSKTDSDIYSFVVDGKVLLMKKNCSNVQDITEEVKAYKYKADYFTVTATVDLKKTKSVDKSETKTENHQTTVTEDVTEYREETYTVEVPNTTTDVSNTGSNINNVVDSGDATGSPFANPDPTTTPSVDTITYTTETIIVQVPNTVPVTRVVDNWVSVTNTWTEYIKIPAKLNLLKSVIASIGSTAINSSDFIEKATKESIKAGVPKEVVIKAMKNVGKPNSGVLGIGEKNPKARKNPYLDGKTEAIKETEKYVVKSGNTLSGIAKKYPGISYKDIANANSIEGPKYIIKVGQVLEIPNK